MYKLGHDKEASPRWAKMLAAGKLSEKAIARLKGMKGLKPRQIGKAPIAEGLEKVVRKGFAGDDVGPAVIKRIKKEVMPGITKEYLDLAAKRPDIFNAPLSIHGDGKGWTEKAMQALTPVGKDPDYAKNLAELLAIRKDKFIAQQQQKKMIAGISDKLENFRDEAQFVRPALGDSGVFGHNPSGKIEGKSIYDLHSGNIMQDEAGVPKIVDALVASPRVKARRAVQKYGPSALSAGLIGGSAAAGVATSKKKDDKVQRGLTGAGIGLAGAGLGIPHVLSSLLAHRVAPMKF